MGEYVDKLYSSVGKLSGHSQSIRHPFYQELIQYKLSINQVYKFLYQKYVVLKYLEERVFNTNQQNDTNNNYEKSAFIRSTKFKQALDNIIPYLSNPTNTNLESIRPNTLIYLNYLQGRSQSICVIHLWMFLIGELFGGLVMAQCVNKIISLNTKGKEDTVNIIQDYNNRPINELVLLYNNWLSSRVSIKNNNDLINEVIPEVNLCYEFLNKIMDDFNIVHTDHNGIQHNNQQHIVKPGMLFSKVALGIGLVLLGYVLL